MSAATRRWLRARYVRLVAAKICIACDEPHDGEHIRCPVCHEDHLSDSRDRYKPRGTGHVCSSCGNSGHNRRTCAIARAA